MARQEVYTSQDGRRTYVVESIRQIDDALRETLSRRRQADARGSIRMGLAIDLDELLDRRMDRMIARDAHRGFGLPA